MNDDKIRAIMAPMIGDPEVHGGLIIQINGTRGELGERGRGLGFVIRDSVGDVIMAGSNQLSHFHGADIAEAEACLFGPPMASCGYSSQISSQRPLAMALALVSAVILSPLYVTRNNDKRYDIRWNSGFVLPMVLAGLIIAIKTTSSPAYSSAKTILGSPDPSWVLRIGGSSWGLAGVLAMLMLALSWQDSVQQFLWK
ncbi:hypothetical protein Cgig2_025177 [Carnegiea gigantea]|uniref:Uncharacterized protein n=1 Tax=Carnegiea gigantea TaxID=171969 RepID=A0A9Q1KRJ9_9CARY|nr:hypothetical protein Cgig2_025177 [Carnegiea gigantea]